MKLANYIIKNIDRWLENDISVLDHFFVAQNNSLNPLIRYNDYMENKRRHIRAKYWENTVDTNLPFMSYWMSDYESGSRGGCKKRVQIVFRFVVSNKDTYNADIVRVDDELEWLSGLQSLIACKFEKSFTLFEDNECQDYEVIDCDGNITIIPFPYNVRGYVNNAIQYFTLAKEKNNDEYREYEMRIPFTVCKIFKDCPCGTSEDDC